MVHPISKTCLKKRRKKLTLRQKFGKSKFYVGKVNLSHSIRVVS